jgi:hypothetical protein
VDALGLVRLGGTRLGGGILSRMVKRLFGGAIVAAVRSAIGDWPGVRLGQRKSFTAFSRKAQFAALSPVRTTGARLGLAVLADEDPLLGPPRRREAWSDRLRAVLLLESAAAVDERALRLLKRAYDGS